MVVFISSPILSLSIPLWAQATPSESVGGATNELQRTEKALDQVRIRAKKLESEAEGLKEDILSIRENLVITGRVIQDHESRVVQIKQRIKKLDSTQVEIRKNFEHRRRQLGFVVGALQRMSRNPPEAILVQPVGPADTVRGAILLRSTLSYLGKEAANYREDLSSLLKAREEADQHYHELNQEMSKLNEQRLRLRRLRQ